MYTTGAVEFFSEFKLSKNYLPSAVNFIAVVYTTSKAKQAKIDKFAIFFFQKIRLQIGDNFNVKSGVLLYPTVKLFWG